MNVTIEMIWTVKDWLWWYYLHACCLFYTSLSRLCVSQFFVFLLNFVVQYRSLCTLQSGSLVFIKPRETIALAYFYLWYMHFLVCHHLHIVHHVRYDCLREIYTIQPLASGEKCVIPDQLVNGFWRLVAVARWTWLHIRCCTKNFLMTTVCYGHL